MSSYYYVCVLIGKSPSKMLQQHGVARLDNKNGAYEGIPYVCVCVCARARACVCVCVSVPEKLRH